MAKTRLFTLTHWLLNLGMGVCAFGGAILCLTLGGVATMGTGLWMPPGVVDKMEGVPVGQVMTIVAIAVLAGIAILGLGFLIFRAVRQIVDSAVAGDPFVVENADRLARIGRLLVAICAVESAVRSLLGVMVPAQLKPHFDFSGFGIDVSPLVVLAILLIFVLAQIFRHGSEMRAELEGTV